MNLMQISDTIFYVGVNDRTTTHFEGLWPIPKGVSYNSYIIKGKDKTALIDTVSLSEFPEFLNNIKSNDVVPTYLIVHHMEPDHSGSIPLIVKNFPGIKIVANKIAIGMIKGFYHLDDEELYIEIKDGDILDLGGDTVLQFTMTPMVHWPETMMSYLESEKTLFSGDAFGTFGALDDGPHDSEYQWDFFEEEMRRYYAAIVGKYSPSVVKAFEKLKGKEIGRICGTHGPVWEKYVAGVIEAYQKMSTQQSEEGVVIVYGSMYGNTEHMVNRFSNMLVERGLSVKKIYNAGKVDVSYILADVWRYKGLVVASPTYSLDIFPPMENFIKAIELRGLKNKVAASLGNYAWAPKVAAHKMADKMAAMGLDVAGLVAMPMSMNPATEKELNALADSFVEKMMQ